MRVFVHSCQRHPDLRVRYLACPVPGLAHARAHVVGRSKVDASRTRGGTGDRARRFVAAEKQERRRGRQRLGGAESGGTIMKSDVVLHLEDAVFALVAAAVLAGVPMLVLLLGLR